jgi:catechol 2,3-dioxygenase-like lactoylglutathione lyase family enzyme
LQALKLGRIGQISRTVKSIEQSKDWYGRILGLPHLYTVGKMACFDCNGTRLALTQSEVPGPESPLYLTVENIGRAQDELKSRGVVFVRSPHLIHTHADGTEDWAAFFNDLEGRPLAILSKVKAEFGAEVLGGIMGM